MMTNDLPLFGDGEFGSLPFHLTGSWPEIDLSAIPSSYSSDPGTASSTWESEWIDLGGEG